MKRAHPALRVFPRSAGEARRPRSLRARISSMIEGSALLVLSPKMLMRRVGNEEGAMMLRFRDGQLYSCNDVTAAFLEALDGQRDFAAVVDLLTQSFEVEPDRLAADLGLLTEQLMAEGLIQLAAVG